MPPYLIVYRVSGTEAVTILRVWHAAQDRPDPLALGIDPTCDEARVGALIDSLGTDRRAPVPSILPVTGRAMLRGTP